MNEYINSENYHILFPIGIILFTILIGTLFNRLVKRFIRKRSEELKNDVANYHFLRRGFTVLIYLLGLSLAVYSVPGLKTLAQSMLAGAGIAAVAIGFASQAALSNIIAGIFIVIFKPFRANDRIEIGTTISGVVEDITLRHTVIRNFNNRRIVIPTSMISDQSIINADLIEQKICQWIEIGISYASDVDKAKMLMQEEVEKHPLLIDNRSEEDIANEVPKVMVRVVELGNFSVNLRAWAWARDQADAFVLRCDLLESLKKSFDAEGIEIPYPYQNVVLKEKSE